jgi:hypothetical protein
VLDFPHRPVRETISLRSWNLPWLWRLPAAMFSAPRPCEIKLQRWAVIGKSQGLEVRKELCELGKFFTSLFGLAYD